jgi:hypothetical protein
MLCPPVLDGQIASLDVAKVAKPLPHRLDLRRVLGGRRGAQEPDPTNLSRRLRPTVAGTTQSASAGANPNGLDRLIARQP